MNNKLITDHELYKLLIQNKHNTEDRRDKINNYYISLLAAILSALPFIEPLTKGINNIDKAYSVRLFLGVLSLIGLILSLTWSSILKQILLYLEIVDERIKHLEDSYNLSYLTGINQQLLLKKGHGKITKYQLVLPYTFQIIFATVIVYSFLWLLQ